MQPPEKQNEVGNLLLLPCLRSLVPALLSQGLRPDTTPRPSTTAPLVLPRREIFAVLSAFLKVVGLDYARSDPT